MGWTGIAAVPTRSPARALGGRGARAKRQQRRRWRSNVARAENEKQESPSEQPMATTKTKTSPPPTTPPSYLHAADGRTRAGSFAALAVGGVYMLQVRESSCPIACNRLVSFQSLSLCSDEKPKVSSLCCFFHKWVSLYRYVAARNFNRELGGLIDDIRPRWGCTS
jgi:hypothetical protein